MNIQLNTDKNIEGSERLETHVKASVLKELSRFSEHITRVEIHLADENGSKSGPNDKRCVLEARMEGKQPLAVTNHAQSTELALQGALHKMKAALDTIASKMKDH